MKTDKIFLTEGYAVPTVERIDIAVEQGFAGSGSINGADEYDQGDF